jgi:hypothetical protein
MNLLLQLLPSEVPAAEKWTSDLDSLLSRPAGGCGPSDALKTNHAESRMHARRQERREEGKREAEKIEERGVSVSDEDWAIRSRTLFARQHPSVTCHVYHEIEVPLSEASALRVVKPTGPMSVFEVDDVMDVVKV